MILLLGYGLPMGTGTRATIYGLRVFVLLMLGCLVWAADARADDPPWPFVGYHWCPGNPFDPAWGPQWDPTTCHDAHHRDVEGLVRTNDYWGPSPFQDWPVIPNTRP